MPRVVAEQRQKFENDDLFRKMSRETEVILTISTLHDKVVNSHGHYSTMSLNRFHLFSDQIYWLQRQITRRAYCQISDRSARWTCNSGKLVKTTLDKLNKTFVKIITQSDLREGVLVFYVIKSLPLNNSFKRYRRSCHLGRISHYSFQKERTELSRRIFSTLIGSQGR